MANVQPGKTRNRLLDAVEPGCAQRILAAATPVDLPLGAFLSSRDERPRHVYFLTSGIASVVFNSEKGTTVELSTEGSEGLVGWVYLLGPHATEGECTMQVHGAGYRVPMSVMQREFDECKESRQAVLEYAQHQINVSNQILACNRLHRAEARFSRWLLMVSDRIQSDNLLMTQEFMSVMLGTRRTTVAEVAGDLARAGAVEGRRGGLRIANRELLEKRSCECYQILKARYGQLFTASPAA